MNDELKRLKGHVLNNPTRLGIMIYLLSKGRSSFKTLIELLDLTPGNLDSHLRVLERVGYIKVKKAIIDRPRTIVIITNKGVEETERYIRTLRRILDAIHHTED